MGFWNLLADADAIEVLIRIGIVVVFMLGPYLLQLLGGKAVQDDRAKGRGQRRKREPQTDLEREIAEFLEQSRGGGSSTARTKEADYVEAENVDDYVAAEPDPEAAEVPPLVRPATDTQTGKAMANSLETQPYLDNSQIGDAPGEEYTYDEAEAFSYDPVAEQPSGLPAAPTIAAMLRDPAHVRNAFVLSEIMSRPTFPRHR